jgi:hypothetical protein
VVEKKKGKVRYLTTIGVSDNASEIELLYKQGEQWIISARGDRDMFIENERIHEEKQVTGYLLNNIENILLNGTQLILSPVFKLIGFDKINDDMLKHLAISRIYQLRF